LLVHDEEGKVRPRFKIGATGIVYRGTDNINEQQQQQQPDAAGGEEDDEDEGIAYHTCGEYFGGNFWFFDHAQTPEASGNHYYYLTYHSPSHTYISLILNIT
jgi:hypothetical protein